MYFYLSYPFIGVFVVIHITEFWIFSVRLALSLERQSNYANSSTEVNGFHSASSFSLNVINALQFTTIELIQSIHRTQCDVILWKTIASTSPMRILDQGRTIPAPALVDYEGFLKMEGTSGLHGRHLPS